MKSDGFFNSHFTLEVTYDFGKQINWWLQSSDGSPCQQVSCRESFKVEIFSFGGRVVDFFLN